MSKCGYTIGLLAFVCTYPMIVPLAARLVMLLYVCHCCCRWFCFICFLVSFTSVCYWFDVYREYCKYTR